MAYLYTPPFLPATLDSAMFSMGDDVLMRKPLSFSLVFNAEISSTPT